MNAIIYKIKQLASWNQYYKHIFRNNNGIFNVEKIPGTSNYIFPQSYFDSSSYNINKITTWNIQELFWYCYKGNKIHNIINKLISFNSEIICLQEVFEQHSFNQIINNPILKQKYPFFLSGTLANRFIIGENSGLLVLSKYPIQFRQFTQFHRTTIPDLLACKGAIYFSVGDLNFITTHLQSGCPLIAKRQLHNIILNSPFKKKTILLGDLNFQTPYKELCIPKNNYKITHLDSSSILDYILSLQEDVCFKISVDYFNLFDCSDHYPVHAFLK